MDSVKFSCSICLDLLKTPVTIPCGHNYCMYCIGSFWDDEDKKGIHSCPQCRQLFTPRPVLVKNTMLAELVEDVRKTEPQPAPSDDCLVGPEDVACDICTVRKMKAVKSCLVCLVSYCENHLQPHYDVPGLKKHKLVNPSKNLQENICSRHDEVMKLFCRTDQQCICYLCTMDEHKGHETVPVATERAEKQKELQESQQQIQQRIQDQEKDVKLLQQEVEAINVSADKAVEDSEKIFTELIRLLQERSSEVKQQIRSQQETEVSRVKDVQEKLEQEITELKRKDAELEQLSHTEDHTQFLLNYPSLPALSEATHSPSINKHSPYFEDVTAAASELKNKVLDILRDPPKTSSPTASKADVLPQPSETKTWEDFLPQPFQPKTRENFLPQPSEPKTWEDFLPQPFQPKTWENFLPLPSQPKTWEDFLPQPSEPKTREDFLPLPSQPKTREDFFKYSRKLTLNRNTAHKFLELSEGNRKVTMTNENQNYENQNYGYQCFGYQYCGYDYYENQDYEDHVDRFTKRWQVLSKQRLDGRCYWEVEWSGRSVEIAVAYGDIERIGDTDESSFGLNENSWALYCQPYKYTYKGDYNNVNIPFPGAFSSRVGVYLDHRAGILSFYSVSGSQMTLLHKVQTYFTQPLHAGIWLSRSTENSAEFIHLK